LFLAIRSIYKSEIEIFTHISLKLLKFSGTEVGNTHILKSKFLKFQRKFSLYLCTGFRPRLQRIQRFGGADEQNWAATGTGRRVGQQR
jgi:hypothetical protein